MERMKKMCYLMASNVCFAAAALTSGFASDKYMYEQIDVLCSIMFCILAVCTLLNDSCHIHSVGQRFQTNYKLSQLKSGSKG